MARWTAKSNERGERRLPAPDQTPDGICLESEPSPEWMRDSAAAVRDEPMSRPDSLVQPLEVAALLDAGFTSTQIAWLEFVRWKMQRQDHRTHTTHTIPLLWEAELAATTARLRRARV